MRHKSLLRTILEPIAAALALAVIVRAAVHIYSIPSRSMAPTLEPGDQILVTRYLTDEPQRGHVVVFEGRNELLVKRVIAVPGDLVDSRLGRVRVGGYTLAEPYVLRPAASGAIDAQVIPSESYYVLGDNRDDSVDSRSWGVVPRERIVGRARMVLWSSASSREVVHAAQETPEPAVTRHRSGLFKWID
ncbi:MAG TPA: signal peptidase I [Thermoanaerobaculia bacterium]|nr:signal peptidase I [Thermoanaerobaculia bacterium]